MQISQKEAQEKASIYQENPIIPYWIQKRFPGWTHFEVRAYHKRVGFSKRTCNGKKRRTRSRRVAGYIFLYLAKENGQIHPKPVKKIYLEGKTRREFAACARGLTMNMDNSLVHAFS